MSSPTHARSTPTGASVSPPGTYTNSQNMAPTPSVVSASSGSHHGEPFTPHDYMPSNRVPRSVPSGQAVIAHHGPREDPVTMHPPGIVHNPHPSSLPPPFPQHIPSPVPQSVPANNHPSSSPFHSSSPHHVTGQHHHVTAAKHHASSPQHSVSSLPSGYPDTNPHHYAANPHHLHSGPSHHPASFQHHPTSSPHRHYVYERPQVVTSPVHGEEVGQTGTTVTYMWSNHGSVPHTETVRSPITSKPPPGPPHVTRGYFMPPNTRMATGVTPGGGPPPPQSDFTNIPPRDIRVHHPRPTRLPAVGDAASGPNSYTTSPTEESPNHRHGSAEGRRFSQPMVVMMNPNMALSDSKMSIYDNVQYVWSDQNPQNYTPYTQGNRTFCDV